MIGVGTAIFYTAVFLSVYVQVFFLVTFLEKRRHIVIRKDSISLPEYPGVTIIVPCWNEEKTVEKTVASLLALEYPKDKLHITIVDDGSTDNTWGVLQKYAHTPNIHLYKKENGGKHTAMNYALAQTTTPFTGCLDADSAVHPEALKRIMTYFADPEIMAVAPSIMIEKSKNPIQIAQRVEYDMAVYVKKMLAFIGGIHVTPGPFSIFRKKVFDDLGNYRKAHNTEDQEIALRMQSYGYKIEHCPDAYVYTVSPNTVKKLYKQRLRWIYGFLNNLIDYRHLLFRKKYGNVALFTLPSGLISIVTAMFGFGYILYRFGIYIADKVEQIRIVGWQFSLRPFDWFYVSTESTIFLSILLYGLVILAIMLGRKMSQDRKKLSLDFLYFIVIYSVVAPFWLAKAVYNTTVAKKMPTWR
ncbi:MAG: glycosyltransferase family 2 protein [Candidatus Pacebacteria bacterium]|jgi:cellulose synthase/poly-beta-1,6-N-acetylglucosamine synthase-like glycosyltransferase|nr:glycosyltransferase family 2 protein [Candidatus Paceibacterota bacterium]